METATLIADIPQPALNSARHRTTLGRLGDFVELAKPRMNFVVVLTTGVGYFMAAHGAGDWLRLLNTLLGTALTAAGAASLNQLLERDLDAKMVRTHNRPLPSGRILPREAIIFGALFSVLGVSELALFVNPGTGILAAFTLLSYVFVYTPLKQYSTLCTIVGAVPGATPILMGWTAARASISPEALALFAILFVWQMPHFLAIAILYRDDYAAGGFKMLPVVDTSLRTTAGQIVLYCAALIPVSLLPALFHTAGVIYLVAALALGLIFAGFGVLTAITRARPEARQLFLASLAYLPLLLLAMMVDKL